MKFDMICIKFNLKKPKFWTFEVFKVFLNLKNEGFFRSHFPALVCMVWMWLECVQIHCDVVYTQWVVLRWRQKSLIVMMTSLTSVYMTCQLLVWYVCLCVTMCHCSSLEKFVVRLCHVYISFSSCNKSYYLCFCPSGQLCSSYNLGIYCIINTKHSVVSQSVITCLFSVQVHAMSARNVFHVQYQHWLAELLHAVLFRHCVSELSVELSLDISDLYLFVMSHCLYDIMSALNVYKYALHM